MADFSVLVIKSPDAPNYQDGDWATATVVPLNMASDAILGVRARAAS